MRTSRACVAAPEADNRSVLQTRTSRSLIGQLVVPLDGGSKDNAAIMTVLSSGQRLGDTIRRVELIDTISISNEVMKYFFLPLLIGRR